MRKGQIILRLTALAIVIAFGVGLLRLWLLRFDAGDIYAPYSSLRTDPLGVRAFYESLEGLPGVTVRRNYKPLKKLSRADGDTLFYIGVDRGWIPSEVDTAESRPADEKKSAVSAIHKFASDGGRVVVTFTPAAGLSSGSFLRDLFGDMYRGDPEEDDPGDSEDKDKDEDGDEDQGDADQGKDNDEDGFDAATDSEPGLSLTGRDADDWRELHKTPALGTNEISIDWPEIPWRGSLHFAGLSEDWSVICQQNDEPVIIEKAVGSGTIVICADSYFLSNEAVINDNSRNPQLLAWLASGESIVFDETHLGVASTESVASLAREHGLANLLFVLLVLAALYIWKSAVSILPRDPDLAERFAGGEIAGRSSAAGLHSLLRRCIPTKNILNECMKHWSASTPALRPKQKEDKDRIAAIAAAENALPARRRDPIKAYAKICEILSERKR